MTTDTQTHQQILEGLCNELIVENERAEKRNLIAKISTKMIDKETLAELQGEELIAYFDTGQEAMIKILNTDHYPSQITALHALRISMWSSDVRAALSETGHADTYFAKGLNAAVELLNKTENHSIRSELTKHISDIASNKDILDTLSEKGSASLTATALKAFVNSHNKASEGDFDGRTHKTDQKTIIQNFLNNKDVVTILNEEAMEKEGLLTLAGKTGSELEIQAEIVGAFAANKDAATREKYCKIAGVEAAKLDNEFEAYLPKITTLRYVDAEAITKAKADFLVLDALSTKLKPPAPVFTPLA